MHSPDYPAFEALIRTAEKLYGKTIDDDTMAMYWRALKDLPLEVVQRRAEEHIKRAKFFPKPFEFRPKDSAGPQEQDAKVVREFEMELAKNRAFWDSEIARDPGPAHWRLLSAYAARISHAEPFRQEEMKRFADEAAHRLIAEYGPRHLTDPHNMHTISTCMGGKAFKRVSDLAHDQREAHPAKGSAGAAGLPPTQTPPGIPAST